MNLYKKGNKAVVHEQEKSEMQPEIQTYLTEKTTENLQQRIKNLEKEKTNWEEEKKTLKKDISKKDKIIAEKKEEVNKFQVALGKKQQELEEEKRINRGLADARYTERKLEEIREKTSINKEDERKNREENKGAEKPKEKLCYRYLKGECRHEDKCHYVHKQICQSTINKEACTTKDCKKSHDANYICRNKVDCHFAKNNRCRYIHMEREDRKKVVENETTETKNQKTTSEEGAQQYVEEGAQQTALAEKEDNVLIINDVEYDVADNWTENMESKATSDDACQHKDSMSADGSQQTDLLREKETDESDNWTESLQPKSTSCEVALNDAEEGAQQKTTQVNEADQMDTNCKATDDWAVNLEKVDEWIEEANEELYETIEDWSFDIGDDEEAEVRKNDFLDIARCHDTWEEEMEKINRNLEKLEGSNVWKEEMEKIFKDLERLERRISRKGSSPESKEGRKSCRIN